MIEEGLKASKLCVYDIGSNLHSTVGPLKAARQGSRPIDGRAIVLAIIPLMDNTISTMTIRWTSRPGQPKQDRNLVVPGLWVPAWPLTCA